MDFNSSSNQLPPPPSSSSPGNPAVTDAAWNGYLLNLGLWTGNRTLANPRGKVLIDLPSRVNVQQFRTPRGDLFVQWRTTVRTADGVETAVEEWSRAELCDFAALAADGCFSVGARVFVGEAITIDHCIIADNARIRTTHAFDWEGCLSGIVAIRERRQPGDADTAASATTDLARFDSELAPSPTIEPAAWRNPRILLDYSVGLWEGRGITVDARNGRIHTLTSRLKLTHGVNMRVSESSVLRIGESGPTRVYEATGRLDTNFVLFAEANVQMILLPGGIIVSSPVRIRPGRPFSVEISFLIKPDCRKRILRLYNRDAEWISTVFINERRAG